MSILLFGASKKQMTQEDVNKLEATAGDLSVVISDDRDELTKLSAQAELAAAHVPPQAVIDSPTIRWFHAWGAGVEWTNTISEARRASLTVTNASGIHAHAMSEHVLAVTIVALRGMHHDLRNQEKDVWLDGPMSRYRELYGRTAVVVGYGSVGRRVAEVFSFLGVRCIGVRTRASKTPGPGLDREVAGQELYDVLPEADIVVSVLPSTAETRGLFDWSAFGRMRTDAVFVNVGRGDAVVESDLVHHLGRTPDFIACLDVTSPEPLPAESLLWDLPNVIITPHVSGRSHRYWERAFSQFLENLERYVAGKPLFNVVDYQSGY